MLLFASVFLRALYLRLVLICSTPRLLCGGALSGAAPGVALLTRALRCKSRRRRSSGPSPNRRVPMISFFFSFSYPFLFFFFFRWNVAPKICASTWRPGALRTGREEPDVPAASICSLFPNKSRAAHPISLPLPDRCCLALKRARSLGDLLYHYSPTSLFCNCLRTFRHFFSLSTNRRRP